MAGKEPVAVFAESTTSTSLASLAAGTHDRETVLVSYRDGPDFHVKAGGNGNVVRIHHSGTGSGVGQFASHREVVEDADVIFVTSAYFKNLSGVAFAMRQSKRAIIAVLELESTGSHALKNIFRAIGESSSRFVFDRDPEKLAERVRGRLVEAHDSWKPPKESKRGLELD
jgi:hypothetical protein